MIGNVMVAVLAWAIIPRELGNEEGTFKFDSWRIFVCICGLPTLIVAILLTTLPESPKYLTNNQKVSEAIRVIKRVFSLNTGLHESEIQLDNIVTEPSQAKESDQNAFVKVAKNTLSLFSPSLWKVTSMMLYINFSIAFGYYGLWLWFPQLFNKLNEYYTENPDASVSVCQITGFRPNTTSTDDEFCGEKPGEKVFINSIIISLAAAPGNLWTIVHMDKLGRKFFLSTYIS